MSSSIKYSFRSARFSRKAVFKVSAVALALALAGCGSGGASSTSSSSTMQGLALDAPVAGAAVTITSVDPLNVSGAQTLGTATAAGDGSYTVSGPTLPSSTVPIFANALDPHNPAVILTSYLGPANTISAAGSTLTSTLLPDLDVSPVTSAALAVYAQINGNSYANLTPNTYSQTLLAYRSDILAIAAAIKAVGDNLCTPVPAVSSTANLAATIAAQSNLTGGSSTTLTTTGTALGGNCPAVLASLSQQIAADPIFGSELDLGDVVDANVTAVAAGTYSLQGVAAELGMTPSSTMAGSLPVTGAPSANVFVDGAVTVSASGQVSSTDQKVTGMVTGNLLSLTVIDGTQSYSLRGKIGVLPTNLVNGGTGYAIRSGGTNTLTQDLTKFDAVLVPLTSTPLWNGWTVPAASTQDGLNCLTGQILVRMDILGSSLISGGKLGECITPSASSWAVSSASGSPGYFDDRQATVIQPTLTAISWQAYTAAGVSAPYILATSSASLTTTSAASGNPSVTESGSLYYVMGADEAVFAWTSSGLTNTNTIIGLHDSVLTRLSEVPDSGNSGDPHSQDH